MLEKIKLSKDKVIVFMGSMNAMPMMYALELKNLGYEVIYFVDVPKKNTLSRPENHFPSINYPYPLWIVEFTLLSQLFLPLFPRLFSALYRRQIRKLTTKNIGCFVLNGFFSSMAPYLGKSTDVICLSHSSDLDVWANTDGINDLVMGFKKRSIFKYIPEMISELLIKNIVKKQYTGYSQANTVVYFPRGFNLQGDKVIQKLEAQGVRYIPRYDISFEPLQGQSREFKPSTKELVIFSGVRFVYKTLEPGDDWSTKGNDIIIEGIAKYYLINPNIRVHFVEKGDDVQHAKELCQKLGIESVVVWHQEMPLTSLLALYQIADICFDQVGTHWLGAIGGYSLWLGKPLIANVENAVLSGVWPHDHPVCQAKTQEEVCKSLTMLEDDEFRKKVSFDSKKFIEAYMEPKKVLSNLFKL